MREFLLYLQERRLDSTIDARFNNIDAPLANAVAMEGYDTIHPVTNAVGHPPPAHVFPGTFTELIALNDNDARTVLLHYDLPADPRATRNLRLCKFLGVQR